MSDGITVTLEIDVDEEEMEQALSKAKIMKEQVRDPNTDNVRIQSIRRR